MAATEPEASFCMAMRYEDHLLTGLQRIRGRGVGPASLDADRSSVWQKCSSLGAVAVSLRVLHNWREEPVAVHVRSGPFAVPDEDLSETCHTARDRGVRDRTGPALSRRRHSPEAVVACRGVGVPVKKTQDSDLCRVRVSLLQQLDSPSVLPVFSSPVPGGLRLILAITRSQRLPRQAAGHACRRGRRVRCAMTPQPDEWLFQ